MLTGRNHYNCRAKSTNLWYNTSGMTKALFAAVLTFVGLLLSPLVFAAPIFVPNGSFESPATFYVSINIDSWQKTPPPPGYDVPGGYDWTQVTGIFKNQNDSSHIDNCDGQQALWIFADTEAGIYQDYDSSDWRNLPPTHAFNATYEVGKAYTLTAGFIGGGGGMGDGATIELILYYRDALSNQMPVAVTVVTNDPTVFVNTTHFVDFHVTLPLVQATDAWASQYIGIKIRSTVPVDFQGGYWDLDNIRLSDEASVNNAPPVLALSNPVVTNGHFAFTLSGTPQSVCEILSSPNPMLSLSNWATAGFVTNRAAPPAFATPLAPEPKFFRARQLP